MSSKNFKAINPTSIYSDVEFYDKPYTQTDLINVYIPFEKDSVTDILLKEKIRSKAKKLLTLKSIRRLLMNLNRNRCHLRFKKKLVFKRFKRF